MKSNSIVSTHNDHQPSPSPPSSSCSSSRPGEIQTVFNYFDQNKDGKISPSELQSCLRTLGGGGGGADLSIEEAEAAVRLSDSDKDGLLGLEDFQRLVEGANSEEEKKEELQQAFQMYESEPGCGFINPNSLKRMLARLGDFRSIDDCKAMIRSFDLNGDGLICFNEFALMMR